MGSLKSDLAASGLELRETHISWVFLGPAEVWKVKKPVSLGFLDFTALESRRAACEAEVTLNRRLAPDVYLDVVPVTVDRHDRHEIAGSGRVVDWAVHMKRLPDHARADVLLGEDALEPAAVRDVARAIATFHDSARADDSTAQYGTVGVIAGNVRENFEQTRDIIGTYLKERDAREIERWQLDFLRTNEALFTERIRQGRVRDGHGDLRLEHVYLDSVAPPVILDCIEFNERFRYADTAADIAFLSMDLAWHRRVDLAEAFLAEYARTSNDFAMYRLIDFYESYRAYVRGKIACIVAGDPDIDERVRARAGAEARRYFLLALASERRSLIPPAVVAVAGIIASGKSTVAEQLAFRLGAPVVDADRTRKHLAGVGATSPMHDAPWQGRYAPDMSERVYAELFRRGRAVLDSGRPVVLDASFRRREDRVAARSLAASTGVPFTVVECRAPADCCRARLVRRRAGRGASVSDGRLEIFDDFLAAWEPIDELPPEQHVILDTTQPLENNLRALRSLLPLWPADGVTP
jgi:uncharacterized protein